ncbi:MAG: HAMP domain-containing protein [Pseudomonadales bacterium]|nr:HAMP domain-containing protein [Pseudomonadales bacterium]MCP5183002.1 HAMP domain-containing protein [Pseudomonadales bacterium]
MTRPLVKLSITARLMIALLGVTAMVLAVTLSLARWNFERGFLDYVNALEKQRLENVADEVAEYYRREGSWTRFHGRWFQRVLDRHAPGPDGRPLPPDRLGPPGGRPPPRPPRGLPVTLTTVAGERLAGPEVRLSEDLQSVPVVVDGETVAFVQATVQRNIREIKDTAFSRQQRQATSVIAIVALALAAAVSLLVARTLSSPLRRMIGNVHKLADGDYAVPEVERRSDELGDLSASIQRLAMTLGENRQARQSWLANISHELRTPVTVLAAELEALKDGVRELSLQQLHSFDQEVTRLRHLVEDLFQLALSEAGGLRYEFTALDLRALLLRVVPGDTPEGLSVETVFGDALTVRGDATRLEQLFVNLWRNSLAYTDVPGAIRCSAQTDGNSVVVTFDDSPPGVTEDQLELLFEPLYRTEASRSRARAGAGLGLAICRNIVSAHGGEVHADASPLGGLRVTVRLPCV